LETADDLNNHLDDYFCLERKNLHENVLKASARIDVNEKSKFVNNDKTCYLNSYTSPYDEELMDYEPMGPLKDEKVKSSDYVNDLFLTNSTPRSPIKSQSIPHVKAFQSIKDENYSKDSFKSFKSPPVLNIKECKGKLSFTCNNISIN
jgi:hypothetical protein